MQKSAIGITGSFWQGLGGFSSPNADIADYNSGFAQAYVSVQAVRSCIDIYARVISEIPTQIVRNTGYDPRDDEVVARSDDVKFRHNWYEANKWHRTNYKIGLIPLMTNYGMLYDSIFVEKVGAPLGPKRALRVLNNLGMNIQRRYGKIYSYQYSWDGDSTTFTPDEIGYDHGFNPFDDNIGSSIVASVINQINISRNLDRFLRAFFINDAMPGMVASPTEGSVNNFDGLLSDDQVTMLRSMLQDYTKGVDNRRSSLIIPFPVNVNSFDEPDVTKQYEIHKEIVKQIFAAFQVSDALVGQSDSTEYKTDYTELTAAFVNLQVKPIAKNIGEFINDILFPFVEQDPNLRFEFDFSKYDITTEADLRQLQYASEAIKTNFASTNDARKKAGMDEIKEEWADWIVVNGAPVPPNEMPNLWQYMLLPQPQAITPGDYEDPEIETIPQPVEPAQEETSDDEPPEPPTPEPEPKAHVCDEHCDCGHTHDIPHKALFEGDTPYPDDETITERLKAELQSWKTFELKRWGKSEKRAFEPNVIEPYIAYAVIDRMKSVSCPEDVAPAILGVLDDEIIKTIASYRRQARSLFTRLWDGRIGPTDFLGGMSSLITQQYTQAFQRGVKRAGKKMSDLTADEAAKLDTLIAEEKNNIFEVMNAILEQDKANGGNIAKFRQRAELWVARYDRIEDKGFVVASGTKRLKWIRDPLKESCKTCIRLDNKVYTAKAWDEMDIEPRSPRLECFGVYCGCRFEETDEPVTRGPRPRF